MGFKLRFFRKMKIGILDRYIISNFLGTYIFTIAMLVIIVIVFDAVEKVDDFLELDASLYDVAFKYYLNFIPFFINQFSGLITFIAVIMFTSKMAYNTEIIAMLSGGVSFKRLMWPYFISALIVATMSLTLNLYIIPVTNVTRIEFEADYLKKNRRNTVEESIYRQVSPNTFISLKGYYIKSKKANFLSISTYDGGHMVSSLIARDVNFNTDTKRWTSSKYITRTYEGDVETLVKHEEKLDTMLNLSASELGKVENYIVTLNIHELDEFIVEQKRKGSDTISVFEVERHNRFAFPASTFILTLIGVSLSSRKIRGGTGLHMGLGIGICFTYILVMHLTNEFAKGGVIDAWIAVWLPNMIFSIVSVVLYYKAPK